LNLSVDFEGETLMEFALRSELKKLKKEVERLNTLLQESEDNAKKQLEDNVKLYGEVERLTFEKEELQEKADRSSGQLETAERSVARYQNLSKDYYKLLDEKDDLEQEKFDLEAHITNQEVMINDKDTQIRNLKEFLHKEQISKRELVVEYITLKSEKIELLDENDDLKEDRKQLTEDNDNLKEDNDRLEEENDRLKEEKADLEASVDALHEEQELMQLLVEDLSNQIKATNPTQDHSESLSYYIIQREDMIDRIVDTIQNSMDLQTAKETVGRIYQNPEYYPVASYLKDEDSEPDADMSYEEFVEDQEVFAGYRVARSLSI
jgi:DNA repair exonuclease SbcCD ATPase subunit